MGSVDLVLRQEGPFQRRYAIKHLLPHLREDSQVRAMFLDEARVAGLISHPNVVSVLDFGQGPEGPYLVMDYVEGLSLNRFREGVTDRVGRVPIQIALRILAQVSEGLHAAHELRGADGTALELVHRDLSPHNILVGFDGVVRVTDFGVAKALGQTNATAEGVLKGKFGYMSPEQLRFERLDRRSDLFSFGVVLYELLTGARLYPGGAEGVRELLNRPPPDLGDERPEVPSELVELAMQLLAKEREHRPATARQVTRCIERVLAEAVAQEGAFELDQFMERQFVAEEAELREADRAATERVYLPAEQTRTDSGGLSRVLVLLLAIALGVVVTGVIGVAALHALSSRDGAPAASPTPAPSPTRSVVEPTGPIDVPAVLAVPATTPMPLPLAVGEQTPAQDMRRRRAATPRGAATTAHDQGPGQQAAPLPRRAAETQTPAAQSGHRIPQWGWEVEGAARH